MTFTKFTKVFLSCLSLYLLLATVSFAATSPESTVSAEKIKQETLDRIRRALDKLNMNSDELEQPRLKAFSGTVESLTENSISLLSRTPDQTSKQVVTDENTIIVRNGRKIKFAEIGLQDFAIAMGLTSDSQTLTALRIVIDTPPQPTITTTIATGTIATLANRNLTLNTTGNLSGLTITLSRRAEIVDHELEDLSLTDLSVGQNVIIIVEIDTKANSNVAYRLMVLPNSSITSNPTPVSSCGDKICQRVVCTGVGCPTPESIDNCPVDCAQ